MFYFSMLNLKVKKISLLVTVVEVVEFNKTCEILSIFPNYDIDTT